MFGNGEQSSWLFTKTPFEHGFRDDDVASGDNLERLDDSQTLQSSQYSSTSLIED